MTSSQSILQSTASYYNQAERRWCYGTLILQEDAIEFQESTGKKDGADVHCVILPLTEVSAIQRKNSSFIFGSIVIISGSNAHWFSSFCNRDSVFNILNLFWQYRAFSNSSGRVKCGTSTEGNTKLGKELLQLIHESEKTLSVAAENLEHQGEQLDHAAEAVDDMNSDLSVAEWLLGLLSPWKFIYRNQKSIAQRGKEDFEFVSQRLDHYCVVYCLHTEDDGSPVWLNGMLETSTNGLKLYDIKLQVIANFSKQTVRTVQIISSWEMKINFEPENQSIVSYSMKCPSLSNLKIVLNVLYGDKITFIDTFPWKINCGDQPSSSTVTWSPPKTTVQSFSETPKASLTDSEIEELNTTIAQLKSLAVVVGLEQSAQMEKIEKLIQTVSKTDIRIKDDIKKIKSLS